MVAHTDDEEVIFCQAVEISSAGERTAFLEQACGTDHELRGRLDALLAAYQIDDEFLHTPPVEFESKSRQIVEPGTLVGRYKLLEIIGEGGFGVVYLAEQTEPVRRTVAVKIIKLGMDTRAVIARFEAERQALALMDHPNIAKVLDAGATDTGRPYFVMDLVRGLPITEYCDANNLTTQQRLELFIDVCHAVQHAHQKGIIHRDLKPSNVLVTQRDTKPVPKIIDFGVAKATQQRLTEKTLFTEHRQLVGTPEYMSPEQATFCEADVDTRSDVYSLGVLLYELLTGATPFDARQLRQAPYDEICRIIRETDPSTPSKHLSALADAITEVSEHRQTQPTALRNLIRGDLDWIVMKCLEKDRTRRYETANALARDIGRVLSDQPVEASPPSASYRLHKFIRRNKMQVCGALLLSLSLVAGTVGTTIGLVRSKIEARHTSDALARSEEQLQRATSNVLFARGQAELHLLDQAAGYRIYLGSGSEEESQELTLQPTSILDWDWAPSREAQIGSVFVWLGGGRPQAIGAVSRELWDVRLYRHLWDANFATRHELHSLAATPVTAKYRGQRVWSAQQAGAERKAIPGASTPSPAAPVRLTQMAALATQFRADVGVPIARTQLALKPDPIYRYNIDGIHETDLMDGALFAFLDVTDPELVLIIEAHGQGVAAGWHYVLARLSERPLSVHFQGQVLWQDRAGTALPLDRNILDVSEYQQQSYISYVPAAIPQIQLGESLRLLANAFETHSLSLWQAGLPDEAEEAATEAARVWDQLKDQFANDTTYRLQLAAIFSDISQAHRSAGRVNEAQSAARDAVELYNELTIDFPDDYRVHRALAYMQAELGQWNEAAAAYTRAAQLDPDPASRCRWYESALLPRLGAGDLEAYRAGCEDLLERFGDTEDPATAHWLVGVCLYVPDAVKDQNRLVKLAATAAGDPAIAAAALYRAGQYKEAAEQLSELAASWEEPDELRADPIRPFKRIVLAMAQHQIGHTEAARSELDRVIRWLDETQPDHAGLPVARVDRLNWWYRLTLKSAREEAEEVLREPGEHEKQPERS